MATTQPQRAKEAGSLRSAAATITSVLPSLNTASGICKTCQRRHDSNFTDAESARQLTRIIGELKRVADILERGADLLAERKHKRGKR